MDFVVELPYKPLFDVGVGKPVILLHGLFGNLSNWGHVVYEFTSTHRVIIPRLPLYANPVSRERLDQLVIYLEKFLIEHDLHDVVLMGNSLGGHIALLFALKNPQMVEKIVLAGSSGLYENSFGGSFPRVKDYDYIREKVASTFYKREIVTKQLVDEVYDTVQSKYKTISIIGLAREAQRNNLSEALKNIDIPTLLIWGLQDSITPPEIALEFHDRLPQSQLIFIDHCGHVPMMEQPKLFNEYVRDFLEK